MARNEYEIQLAYGSDYGEDWLTRGAVGDQVGRRVDLLCALLAAEDAAAAKDVVRVAEDVRSLLSLQDQMEEDDLASCVLHPDGSPNATTIQDHARTLQIALVGYQKRPHEDLCALAEFANALEVRAEKVGEGDAPGPLA